MIMDLDVVGFDSKHLSYESGESSDYHEEPGEVENFLLFCMVKAVNFIENKLCKAKGPRERDDNASVKNMAWEAGLCLGYCDYTSHVSPILFRDATKLSNQVCTYFFFSFICTKKTNR